MIEEDALCGKYRLEKKIAEGGFGEVWLVRHAELPKRFAAKFILDPACAAYLRREGDLLCSLEHPNVVLVVDAEFQAERPFIVMEHVTGGSLRDRIARGPIPLAEALDIARTVMDVLVFAHAKGIVHRDLKPENILFNDRGQVKVCDFGLGKVLAGHAASLVLSNAPADSSGKVIVGTIEYMSPEQRAGGPSDPRNDLFAWGVTLYEMLLGRRPSGFVPKWPTEAGVAGATPALDRLLQRSLCEIGDRFQTAAEALCALDALGPRQAPPGAAPPPPRRIIWHRLHPEYLEWLLARVSPTEVLLEGDVIPVPDVRILARDGCVDGQSLRSGVRLAQVSAQGLLVSGHLEILAQWLQIPRTKEEARKRPFLRAMWQLLVEGATEAALMTIRQAPTDSWADDHLDLCVLLATVLGCRGEARSSLLQAESRPFGGWYAWRCAVTWMEVFGDDANARRCLQRAEDSAKTPLEWHRCAQGWKVVFADDANARRCLRQAEAIAEEPLAWHQCAQGWKEVFADDTNARRCLQRADAIAEEPLSWHRCALGWKKVFADEANARRCLQQAEAIAKTPLDWRWCAQGWNRVLSDDANARKCLQQAEAIAKTPLDWRWCAKGWKEDLADESNARRCLQQAEAIAKEPLDWRWCADYWKQVVADDANARRCLQQAEAIARTPLDWRWCAQGWKEVFADEANARRCLQQAEAIAKGSLGWQSSAEGWKEVIGDEVNTRRCLQQAEASAKDSSDWRRCAEGWKKVLGDEANARRCLQQAEAIAKFSFEWLRCAEDWKTLLDDDESALRCLDRAKELEEKA